MNFIQLEYFRKVVDCGGVTKASKELFITQPAVSKQIHLLEEELRCQLFLRRSKGLILTREGEFLYERAKSIVSRINDLGAEMNACLHRVSGRLNIGCGPHTSRTIMPDIIAELIHRYPAVLPAMREKDWSESTEDLLNGRLDIVIGVPAQDGSPKTAFTRLFRSRMVLIYSRFSSLASLPEITAEALAGQPFITYADDSILNSMIRTLSWLKASPVFLRSRYSETLITYAERNLGFAVVPEYVLQNFTGKNLIVSEFPVGLELDIGFLLDASRSVSPAARALIRLMKAKYLGAEED